MLKLGIVPSQPFHNSLGTDVRLVNLISSLSKMSVEIHFITPFNPDLITSNNNVVIHAPEKPTSNQKLMELFYPFTRSLFNRPFWSRSLLSTGFFLDNIVNSFVKRIKNLITDVDLDIILSELEIASMACIKMKTSLKVPIITDIHGSWAEEIIAAKIIRDNSIQSKNIRDFEKKIFKEADAIIGVSPEARNFFSKNYEVPKNKITVVPGGSIPKVEKVKRIPNPSKIVFSGMVTYREHVDLLIRSIPYVIKQNPDVKVYLTKKGDKLNEIKQLSSKLNVNSEFFYYSKVNEFFNFLADCHIGVLTSTRDLPRQIAYPAKLFDYMSVGLPVVCNDVGGWTNIIKENKIGIVTNDSPKDFAKGILQLLNNPELMLECGQRGLDLIKTKYNYDESARILFELLNKIISAKDGN